MSKDEISKYFPYQNYREKQLRLIKTTREAILKKKHLVVQAPAGFGKTICILAGALEATEKNNLKILWTCRTHREADRVIEEAKEIHLKNSWISAITIRARSEMCPMPINNEIRRDSESFSILCSEIRKRKLCPYYNFDRIEAIELPAIGSIKNVTQLCLKENVCPYESIKRKIEKYRIISLTYLYVLKQPIFRRLNMDENKCILIIDEAHNILEAAQKILSEKLTCKGLKMTLTEAKKYEVNFVEEVSNKILKIINEAKKEEILNREKFASKIKREAKEEIEKLARHLLEKGMEIRRQLALENKIPRSHIYHLGKFLSLLKDTIGKKEFSLILREGEIEILCFDPKNIMQRLFKKFHITISLSGTISKKYNKLVGISQARFLEISLKYHPDQILSLIAYNVTSDYEKRNPQMYRKMLEYIIVSSEIINAGIGVFTASYNVLKGIIDAGMLNIKKPIFIENENMTSRMNEIQINLFKEKARKSGAIYLGVCGGRASEGVDYPGKEMDIVILAGIPFPEPTPSIKAKTRYYEEKFGRGVGKLYGYIIPSMWKVAQAAGRVIRSPKDRGAIIYLDKRYLKYSRLLPKWMRPKKIVHDAAELKEEISLFFA